MKLIKMINFFFDQVAKILFFLIIVLVFAAAVARSRIIGKPIPIAMDLAGLLFAWVVFLGADMALRANSHIGIDYITKKLPEKFQRVIMVINYLIILIFLGVIIAYGVYLCIFNFERKFSILQISYSFATASVPVGCSLMFITVIRKLVSIFRGEDFNKKFDDSTSTEEEGEEECY